MAEIALAGATAVLRQTVCALSSLVFKEGSGLSQLRDDVIWLESEMRHIQSYLEDAEAKQETSRGVANLMIDMRDLAHDVEDIMEKYFPRIASHQMKGFGGCLRSSACVSCYGCAARDFVIEIEGIKRRVENIHRVRQTYGINECSGGRSGRDMWDERRSFPHVDEPNVVGFEKHIDNLVAKMRSKELRCRVVSIIGMPGLGKTTLAKKVYKSIQHSFEHSAWIYVSQQANINELLQDIARQVGLEKEKWEENFEANLCTLLSEHRYVIVLDDIWHMDTWDAIKNAIPTNKENGSRIILTSRNRDVGTHVGGLSSLHELPTLNEENSRELFFKMVMNSSQTTNGTSDPPQPQLKSIGEQILKRCGGVPLAIVLTAGLLSLREKSENEWKRILEGMGQDQDQCSEIFALSYKDLPSNLKPCFLYFGLFPEDHEISAFDLINLWAAEGFIRASGLREVEDVGDDYVNHLQARNLIQVVRRRFDGRVKSCRIHHILHGLCIRVAKEINFFNTHNDMNTYNATLRVRRVTTLGSDFGNYLSLNSQTPKLRAMLCFNGDLENMRSKNDKNFLQGFRFLRVLSVKSDYLSGYLPIEVGNWRHLTYLGLGFKCSHDQFVELPHTISNLRSLLTLDVQECYGVILPHVIWSMKQLRHILLPQYCRARSFYGVKFIPLHLPKISFPNLRTLHGLPGHLFTSDGWRKLTNLKTLRVNFPTKRMIKVLSGATPISRKLEELRLLGNKNCNALNLSRYENLVEVHFQKMWSFELPQHGMMPPNLTKLTLERTYLEEDPIKTLQKLPKLKILKLSNIRYNGNKMVCSGEHGNFPQLQVLKIKGMLYQEFVIEEEGMPSLQEFWIRECRPMTIRIPDRIRNIMITDYQTKRVLASRVQR